MDAPKPPSPPPPFALTPYPTAPRVHIDLDPNHRQLNTIHQQLQQPSQDQPPQQPQQQLLQQQPTQPLQQPPHEGPYSSPRPPPLTMPDLPSSPRKTLSSTSQAARNPAPVAQPQKKPGAPKPKGAVRAKSGCYTCRIRRKKCDEQPNEQGYCQTCVRLRLQCLGFGAKRPDWMRENNSVTELREKIKTFLASQGMIKGHSGSGPRTTDGDPPVLILVDNLQANPPPATPPTPTLSTSSNDGQRQQQGPMTSYVRDNNSVGYHGPPGPATMPPEQHQYPQPPQPQQTTWSTHLSDLNNPSHPHSLPHTHDPALRMPPQLPGPEAILFQTQAQGNLMQSGSLVPPITSPTSQSSWPIANGISSSALYEPNFVPHPTSLRPALESNIARSYNYSYGSDDDLDSPEQQPDGLPLPITHYDPSIPRDQQILIAHYMSRVLPIQYLLSDSNINRFIYDLIRSSTEARDAACMLAAIHRVRTGGYDGSSDAGALTTVSADAAGILFERLFRRLVHKQQPYTEGDAMAGLHAVSTILFAGGRGAWAAFLDVASAYVRGVLADTRFYGPEDVLRRCGESTRFIVKTTMWFDVLASVTTASVPRFLETYRELFDRSRRAFIDVEVDDAPPSASSDPASASTSASAGGPSTSASAANQTEPPETSMLPIMGCENSIVLAIAEISNLAHWKEAQARRNALSIPRLVELGRAIEEQYLVPAARSPIQSTAAGAYTHAPAGLGLETAGVGMGMEMGMQGMGMQGMQGMQGMNGMQGMQGMSVAMNGMNGMGPHPYPHPHQHPHAMNGMPMNMGMNGHPHAHMNGILNMNLNMNGLAMGMHGPAPPPPPTPATPATPHPHAHAHTPAASEVQLRRHLTNDIFRASARVYLHTVLSGDYPSCPEIAQAVSETIDCLRRVPLDSPLVSRNVLRSVVFGICISGCLTDNREQRAFLMQLLETQDGEHVGNVAEVRDLMRKVWTRRDSHRGAPVNWREVMREGEALLLV